MSPSDHPIRVLRVIARLNVGGPALHVSYLTEGLARHGYETMLVAGRVGEGEGSMEYAARASGVDPVFIPALQRELEPLSDGVAVRSLRAIIREFRPHVLHTHTAKAGAVGRMAALLAGNDRPPVIVHTFHGHVLRGYFGPAKTRVFGGLERALAQMSDALIAVSPEVRDDLVDLGVVPAKDIVVIRLGLDLERRTRTQPGAAHAFRDELGVPRHRLLVGWLGRMTEIKRTHDLLEAVAILRAGGTEIDVVLVGDGPLRAELEQRAVDLGLGSAAHFVGFREDVAPVYAALDIVALTSANEGTPVSIIEALAAGRAVISTDVGGVRDVVRDGETGFLVPAGDVDGIADRLGVLARNGDLRTRFGDRARSTVLSRYAIPRLLTDVDCLYRALLEEKLPAMRSVFGKIGRPLTPALPPAAPPRRQPRQLRVVVLSQYFPPEVGATQSRIQTFAEHLAAQGHEVTVVCEFPNHPHGVIPDSYRGRLIEDDRSNAYCIFRTWVWASEEKTQLSRMQFYLSYMALATLAAPMAGRADVILATSPPLFTGLAGAALARLMCAPFVLDVRDLWPAAAVSLNQLSNPAALEFSRWVERRLYRESETVVTVTRPFCRHIDALRGRAPRAVVIPNGTLPQFFIDDDGVEARASLGVRPDRFLATFAGTHGIAQALPSLLEAAKLSDPEIEFALVGEGPIKASLVAEARRRELGNVHFHPQVSREEIPQLLRASDALIVPLSAHPTFEDFVPSKLFDFMATGRPIVLAAAGESARIVRSTGAGVAVAPEDPLALAGALNWLRANPGEGSAMGARGRAFARTRLRKTQAERLEQVLLDVVEQHTRQKSHSTARDSDNGRNGSHR